MSATRSEPEVYIDSSDALPFVHLSVSVREGTTHDPEGLGGLTRVMARLMRRTAGNLDANAIDHELDRLGGSIGIDATHSTLTFSGTVIKRSLEPFCELLLKVIAAPGFAEAELERLKRESESELIDARDDDRSLARRWFRRTLFAGHPDGRSVNGTIASIRKIDRGSVLSHWDRMLKSEELVFGFAGDLSESRARAIAGQLSAQLPSGKLEADAVTDPTVAAGRRLLLVDKPQRTQTQVLIGGLGSHARDPDHIALHVANTAFGGTFTARLTQEVRAKRGWSYGAYSSLPLGKRRSAFSMWTFPSAQDVAPCVALELELLGTLIKDGLTEEELDRAKKYLIGSHAFAVDTPAKRVALKLDEALYHLPPGYFARYVEHVRAVTLDEANAAIRLRLSDRDLLVAVVGTRSDIGAALGDAIPNLASTEVVAFDAD